ncbi:MAG: hypothetical protein COU09_00655 [Candidatus Harrisonbacteria bacterium CG10_big_fil_rev_8_21_14_0_10_44_23]|uniref:Uncharacterized protein n=1 Tax=Candidatus Harrisonbacteria bacterium CG10_big_fil_rev_8_21_14_0_10_44_23 TaxID=1974585 RepID=A0A2H0UQR7_9BACT|nr:MAG: hypothetical protein COU09_00655 [Candidatus Harrisonbacteria bacterium CG10_big_fil_rev_8_21_14_0_10_44_23]
MFEDLPASFVVEEAPLFVAHNLYWGLGLIVLSIIFSLLAWPGMKGLAKSGQQGRAILLWLIDAVLFISGIALITRAFPRVNPLIILSILVVLMIALIGGGSFAVKETKSETGTGSDKQKTAPETKK